ncbi:PRC-barrel domain-containing protein [uncultured Aquabacterium sp.]|jgi:sporulation protein YlmC with PRC-barrel domain|uniref:PRC-barrel domain-containing protein n=1 Tax=uncultured Aquabacterium sp. TaxID=158753 RepID=UPI00262BB50A|nr:PRC-barrel domain-containing protein [uncultured Aquabacterium sp.]
MLHKASQLKGAVVTALDGEVGVVDALYFDDEQWGIRYLGVRTGHWPSERHVLIPPTAIRQDASTNRQLQIELLKDDVLHGPQFDSARPLTRRQERAYAAYYDTPLYWEQVPEPMEAGEMPLPVDITGSGLEEEALAANRPLAEAHIHCTREVLGYNLTTPEGQIGKVDDLLIDEQTWAVQQLIVDTARWRPGGEIAVPIALTRGIDREHDAVYVSADKETLQSWPAYH